MQRKGGQKAVGSTRVETPVRAPARAPVQAAALAKEVRPAVVPARPGGNVAPVSPEPRPAFSPLIEMNQGEAEHRHFPRAQLATRFEVWVDDEAGERRFEASLVSVNVSVSGAFLESTFYLQLGTVLGVRFALEPGAAPVQARAEIVREERGNGPEGRSGFGVRFLDFSGQTEVALARLFVGMRLRAFAEDYLKSQRARSLPNEVERVVDVLAAWELLKATSSVSDPWQG